MSPTIQQTEGGVTENSLSDTGTDESQAVVLALPTLATVVTLFRLAERLRQRRVWYDDVWAAIAMMLNTTLLVVSWLYLHNHADYSRTKNIVLYYMVAQFFCATVWASRISILFTVIRLTSPASALRKMLLVVFVVFLITWAILFAQAFWVCETEPGWKSEPRPQCDLGKDVAIAQIITDVLGDTILIIVPFRLVYRVKLNRAQKIRILSIFSASAITTIVCVTHAYYVLTNGGLKEAIAALVETSVSLIVANLSVVVAFIFRISTDETSTFSPKELKSIVTFGSQPIRKRRAQHDPLQTTVVGVETTTIMLDDFGSYTPEHAKRQLNDDDLGTPTPPYKPSQLSDV